MNAKQRKTIRTLVNDMLKPDGANIAITPVKDVIGKPIIEFKFEGIDFGQAMELINQIPEDLDFDRIN